MRVAELAHGAPAGEVGGKRATASDHLRHRILAKAGERIEDRSWWGFAHWHFPVASHCERVAIRRLSWRARLKSLLGTPWQWPRGMIT
jgi:hypothetical protein